jgi:hypothetical protein
MNISIIDYIGIMDDGIGVILSWNIDDKFYELVFWFNKENRYKLYASDELLKRLKVEDIYEWDQVKNLIIYINAVLPPKEKIYDQFNL